MPNIDLTRVVTAQARARAAAQDEAQQTLASTDWMVIRAFETGIPVPEDAANARAAARRTLDRDT